MVNNTQLSKNLADQILAKISNITQSINLLSVNMKLQTIKENC